MQIDKTSLDRLLSLDDATLARTINLLCAAAGIPAEKASSAVGNLRMVRSSLSNATEEDIKKAMSILGEERASALFNMLGGDKNEAH